MKRIWQILLILLVGTGVALGPGSLAGWARPNHAFDGHGHGREKDREDRGRGNGHREHWNRGHHEHWDNGRHRGWDRDHEGRYRFSDYDRRAFVGFYREHRDERWFRERAPRGLALAYGRVLGPRYRHYCHPVPVVVLRELPPPPPRCHYLLFGGNVVLVNEGYRVQDFIQLSLNFGR